MINVIDCMYSKLPDDDELLIYSKYVEDIYWNKLWKKLHLVCCYFVNVFTLSSEARLRIYNDAVHTILSSFLYINFISSWSVPWLRKLTIGLSAWKNWFNSWAVPFGFVVGHVEQRYVNFLRSRFSSVRTGTIRNKSKKKKAIPLQVWTGPWGFQEVEAPRFQDNRHMKLVRLSALSTGCLYPQRNIPGTHFCYRLSRPQWP